VEDFFELVQHKQHTSLGRVWAGRHGQFAAEGVEQSRQTGLLPHHLGNLLQTAADRHRHCRGFAAGWQNAAPAA
jgi:hypothetical protein